MAKRPAPRREQDFSPGEVTGWPPGSGPPNDLARRARYGADGKHKDYPAPNGEWSYVFRSEGTKCPKIASALWPKLQEALHAALTAGVVQCEHPGEFPRRAWIYLNGRLCEARRTNAATGEYHGFPLDHEEHYPRDPENRLSHAPRIHL